MNRKRFMSAILSSLVAFSLIPTSFASADTTPLAAFPGAEGGAKYITGARGGANIKVYTVTTLADYDTSKGEKPIPGSLRSAVEYFKDTTDPQNNNGKYNGSDGRIVVFAVSGTVKLKKLLTISAKNLTIDGGTAPGDGITVGEYMVKASVKNTIIRNIRFRGGNAALSDTLDFGNYTLIDHCSFSWSTDETLSAKQIVNSTIQYCIISDSLNVSKHDKGAHGYGGIWGGNNVSYTNNLIMNHTSRNPRFDRTKDGDTTRIEFVNNVVYNYGKESTYGGEGTSGINMINNYFKPGPSTFEGTKTIIANPSLNDGGNWYIEGNYVDGQPGITADNWAGGVQPDFGLSAVTRLTQPADVISNVTGGKVNTPAVSAQEAYERVLKSSGAIAPKRDSLDARLMNDVKNGTGSLVNTKESDGGYPAQDISYADCKAQGLLPKDTDSDGIPDDVETKMGLDPNKVDSCTIDTKTGYTYMEEYLQTINGDVSNPTVNFVSPEGRKSYAAGTDMKFVVDANAFNGASIAKVELMNNDQVIGTFTNDGGSRYSCTLPALIDGSYNIYAKATDTKGMKTLSTLLPIYMNINNDVSPWTFANIGQNPIQGSASKTDNVLTVKGSGIINNEVDKDKYADSFGYAYKEVEGNFDITSKVDFSPYIDSNTMGGFMLRKDLSQGSIGAMIGMTRVDKIGYRPNFLYRTVDSQLALETNVNTIDEPYTIRMTRVGNKVTGYVLYNTKWLEVGSAELDLPNKVYLGIAVDANKSTSMSDYLSTFNFTDLQMNPQTDFVLSNQEQAIATKPDYVVQGQVPEQMNVQVVQNSNKIGNANVTTSSAITVDSSANFGMVTKDDGTFSCSTLLKEGQNQIQVIGTNLKGIQTIKNILVEYVITPIKILVNNVIPQEVTDPTMDLQFSTEAKSTVSVILNGAVILSNKAVAANEVVNQKITWAEDNNVLEIVAVDEYGVKASAKYNVKYTKEWNDKMFSIKLNTFNDAKGNVVTDISNAEDICLNMTISNNTEVQKVKQVNMIVYDAQGNKLSSAKIKKTFMTGQSENTIAAFKLPKVKTGCVVKVFVGDSDSVTGADSNISTVNLSGQN
jgi:hypothetical protein